MREKITLRQFLVLEFVALMPPLIRATPSIFDRVAGRGGYLSFVVAFAVMAAVVSVLSRALRRLPEGGLGELYCVSFGDGMGRLLSGVSAGLLLLIMVVALRFYGERFVSSLYPETDMGMFFLVGIGLALWLDRRPFGTLARSGQIFFLGIVVVIVGILAMNLPSVRLYEVWPVGAGMLGGVAKAGYMGATMLSIGVGLLFSLNQVNERRGGEGLALWWLAGICLLYLCMAFVITGVFSAHLTPALQIPFFALAKEVRIVGALERMESFVAALWVFADVVMLAMLLRSFRCALGVFIGSERRELSDGAALFLVPAGYLIAGSVFSLEKLFERGISAAAAVCFLALPVAAAAVGALRRRF